ncbi:uncharacterized protein LOC126735132 isoform X2 [Anthonomus grandis grandis]|uniref:uncharacterized protein LOC126735132 isoform X2 n=1 Tax=Anthonomus grandis grandis TaxID=2921223 RepID=UPI0021653F8B|nr:uncharacterized protein LOC126735132 isoform X2 [Anthonomus grandis grandis]
MTSVSAKYLKLIQNGLDVNWHESVTEEIKNESIDGFMGMLKKIRIQEKSGLEHRLILKVAPGDPALRIVRPITLVFNREYETYSKILPELANFQAQHKISAPFTAFPQFYGGSTHEGKETILMEDLTFKGFKCHEKYDDGMDFNHMSLMFKEYAKLHAASLALGYKDPDKFKKLTSSIEENIIRKVENEDPKTFKILEQIVIDMGKRVVNGNKNADLAQKKYSEIFPEFWKTFLENSMEQIFVISHGDCHPNNMFFLYKDCAKVNPQKMCLIDWQLSAKETPIHDLSFALFSSASKEALSRCDDLFRIYHKSLSQNLREFECDPEQFKSVRKNGATSDLHFFEV